MSAIQCPICDYSIDAEQTKSVIGLLGKEVISEDDEQTFLTHLNEHTVGDWVQAFAMADRYIAQLERALEEHASTATQRVHQLQEANQRVFEAEAARPSLRDVPPLPASTDARVLLVDDLNAEEERMRHYLTPHELQAWRKRQEAARAIQEHDSNETLIPFIPTGQRPEGVVGRKG